MTGVKGIKTVADVGRVQGALDKERTAHRTAAAALKLFGDIPAEGLAGKLQELAKLQITKGVVDDSTMEATIAARVKLTEDEFAQKLEKATTALAERDATILGHTEKAQRTAINDALRTAAGELKITAPGIQDDILMHSGAFSVTESGAVVTNDANGVTPGQTPKDWLSKQLEGKSHWAPTNTPGRARSGTGGGGKGDESWDDIVSNAN